MGRGNGDDVAVLDPALGHVGGVDIGRIGGHFPAEVLERLADRIEAVLRAARDQAEIEAGGTGRIGPVLLKLPGHLARSQVEAVVLIRIGRFDHRVQIVIDHGAAASLARILAHLAGRDQATGGHQVEEHLLGRRAVALHRHRPASEIELQAQVLRDVPQHLVFVDHVTRCLGYRFGIAGIGALVPPFGQVGDVLTLKALLGREHHIGALGAGAHPRIDLHEQFEIVERAAHLELVGKAHFRVATDRDQRPDLAFARGQDFVSQDVAGHFVHQLAKPAKARLGHARRAEQLDRRADLRAPGRLRRGEDARDRAFLAFLLEAGADGVEAGDEIFGQRAIAGHFRAGPGYGAALRATGEHPCSCNQLVLFHPGPRRRDIGGKGGHRLFQLVEPIDVRSDEIAVVKLFIDDDVEHACQQCGIFARLHLQVNVGQPGHIADPRIRHDQFQALRLAVADAARGAERRHAARRRIMRDHRIVADQQCNIGFREGVGSGHPLAIAHCGENLGRLVKRNRSVEIARADRLRQAERGGHRRTVLISARAHENRDAVRAIGVDDAAQLARDMPKRLQHRGRLEFATRVAHQALRQTVFGIVRVGQFAPLEAGVAAIDRIVRVALDLEHLAVFDLDQHRAIGVAEPAESLVRLDTH